MLHRYVSPMAFNVQGRNYHTFLIVLLKCRVNVQRGWADAQVTNSSASSGLCCCWRSGQGQEVAAVVLQFIDRLHHIGQGRVALGFFEAGDDLGFPAAG